MIALNKLNPDDIDEKIRLNEKDGIGIVQLKAMIKEELKDFQWVVLRAQIQCQSYTEQLEHIDRRIKEFDETGAKNWERPEVVPAEVPGPEGARDVSI